MIRLESDSSLTSNGPWSQTRVRLQTAQTAPTTTFAEVSGGETPSSSVGGRAFVKVYAVSRTTGDQFLVLYEDVARRKRPVQIIRFVRGTDPARPGSHD